MRYFLFLCLFFLLPSFAQAQEDELRLSLLHTSETHANHLPQADNIGGVARQATILAQIRAQNPQSLLVDVGGRFGGTVFHEVWRGGDNSQVMNALGYDLMVLGRSEFGEDDRSLGQFLSALNFPVVGSNLDAANSPELAGKILRITTLQRGGRTLGIIGLTPVVEAETGVIFQADYLNQVQDAVNGFRERGIGIIILLSALDYPDNMALATELSGVDIMLGGGDASLLSNLYADSVAAYPQVMESEEPFLFVQAGADNRFLGRLDVVFDANGLLKSWQGEPILLYEYLPDDPEMLIILDDLQRPVADYLATQLRDETGAYINLESPLRRGDCLRGECFLGSLLADAMRDSAQADLALIEAGIFAGDFNAGRITNQQIFNFLDGNPHLRKIEISGLELALWMEESLSALDTGLFLQVSGLRLRYDESASPGARLISLEVERGAEEYEAIDLEAPYTVAVSDSLLNSYFFEGESPKGDSLRRIWVSYLQANSPLPLLFKDRIIRRN